MAAVQEVIRIAEEGGLPGIVSHMKALGKASWGLSYAATMRIKSARARGVEVYADQYPYAASGTGITGALVPRWAQVGGSGELRRRIDGTERARLVEEVRKNIEQRGGAATLVISRFRADPSLEGKSLADLSAVRGKPSEEVALDLLRQGSTPRVCYARNRLQQLGR